METAQENQQPNASNRNTLFQPPQGSDREAATELRGLITQCAGGLRLFQNAVAQTAQPGSTPSLSARS